MYIVHTTMYTMYIVHTTMYTMYIVHTTMYTMYIVHTTMYTMYIVHTTMYTMYIVYTTMYTMNKAPLPPCRSPRHGGTTTQCGVGYANVLRWTVHPGGVHITSRSYQ